MDQFEEEKITVKKFFSNQGIDCDNFIFSKKEEPCDVYCENTDQEFQITWSEHLFQGKIRTDKRYDPPARTIEEKINDVIITPVLKKINDYGKSAKEIILLVPYHHKSSHFDKINNSYLVEAKNKIKSNNKIFFKEIYLVCTDKNVSFFN